VQYLLQVHAEAQPHDRRLEQNLGEFPGFVFVRVSGDCTEREAGQQSEWWRCPRREAEKQPMANRIFEFIEPAELQL